MAVQVVGGKNKKIIWLVVAGIFVAGCGGWWGFNWYRLEKAVPEKPEYSYVDAGNYRLSETGWSIGYVQPVVLGVSEKGGSMWLDGAIRDTKGKVVNLRVLLEGKLDGQPISLVSIESQSEQGMTSTEGLGKIWLKKMIGKQVRMMYFFDVTKQVDWQNVVCGRSVRACQVADYAYKKKIRTVLQNGKKQELPAVYISSKLEKSR